MTSVNRQEKIKLQISFSPFLLFVLTSVVIHGLGLAIFVLSNRNLPATRQKTELTPIDFVVIPPETTSEVPPPDTERRAIDHSVAKGKIVEPELPTASKLEHEAVTDNSEPISAVPSASELPQKPASPSIAPARKPVEPDSPQASQSAIAPATPEANAPTELEKVPKRAITPATPEANSADNAPTELEKVPKRAIAPATPEVNSATALPEKLPLRETETTTSKPDLPPVATNSPPQPKPIEPSVSAPETPAPPSEPETPVGSGAASLLGGSYSRSLADDTGSSFANPQANASQQALNSSGVDTQQDLDLGPYLAEIRRRVKRNWQPSAPGDNRHTVLAFSIQRNGQITGLRVIQSSGSEEVDRESLTAVQKSGPFAALPQNFPKEQLDVEFNFNIYVNQVEFTPQLENWQRF